MRRQQKIYDAKDERIVSKIVHPLSFFTHSPKAAVRADFGGYMPLSRYKAKKRLMEAAIDSSYQALGVPYLGVDRDSTSYPPDQLRMDNTSMKEDLIYFYHKDHLGSSNAILDSVGNILQWIEYLPYGEVMVDEQHSADYATPYKFNGKELDEETGLLYYGARYFDPKRVLWYSTDALQEKYPWVSSYSYTLGNPVRMIDLFGDEPIYSKSGDYLGSSAEGFTGQVYVFYGKSDVDFSKYKMKDLLRSGLAGRIVKYDVAIKSMSEKQVGNFVSKVLTHMTNHFDGSDVLGDGTKFDFSMIKDGKIGYRRIEKSSFETYHSDGKIVINANTPLSSNYEATVENLMSSIIVHEWAGHGLFHYDDAKWFKRSKHHLAYDLVRQKNMFYSQTTKRYKNFIKFQYEHYYKKK